jgi:hypothetical protein
VNRVIILSAALCLTFLGFGIINAQEPLLSGCSSAGNSGGPVMFNCDFTGTAGNGVGLHYRGQSESSFNTAAMNPVGRPPDYEFTYQSTVNFSSDPGTLEYYFSAQQDTLLTTQSPKNTNNQFPPSSYKYAHFLADPQGDMAGGSAGNWLDLTGSGMSYSDTRLYFFLQNRTGTWPQSQLFTYFVYTAGFMITSGPEDRKSVV